MIEIIIREPCNSEVVRTARNLLRGRLQAVEQSAEGFGVQTVLALLPGEKAMDVIPYLRDLSLQTKFPITVRQDGAEPRLWRAGQEVQGGARCR